MSTYTHPEVRCKPHKTPANCVVDFHVRISAGDTQKEYLLACGDCVDAEVGFAQLIGLGVNVFPMDPATAEQLGGVYTGLVSDSAVDSAGRHWVLVDPGDNQATALWECPASGEGALWQELAGLVVQQWCAGRFGDRGCSR